MAESKEVLVTATAGSTARTEAPASIPLFPQDFDREEILWRLDSMGGCTNTKRPCVYCQGHAKRIDEWVRSLPNRVLSQTEEGK